MKYSDHAGGHNNKVCCIKLIQTRATIIMLMVLYMWVTSEGLSVPYNM